MIIPEYDENLLYEDNGLNHSFQYSPEGYSEPQDIYKFYYKGDTLDVLKLPGEKNITWSIDYPFYILNGQGTTGVTIALLPVLTQDREKIIIVSGLTQMKYSYRNLKYCPLTFKISKCDQIKWEETLNLKYKQGPLFKIEGNMYPKKDIIETYTIIPKYFQNGYPPKNIINNDSFEFKIKGGRVKKIYGGVSPYNCEWKDNFVKVDIEWYEYGSGYLSFYSSWKNEKLKFPNTLKINVNV